MKSFKLIDKHLANYDLPALIKDNAIRDFLSISNLSIATSGTATLESAILECPPIICYKTNFFNYLIISRMLKMKDVGLPNLLLGDRKYSELKDKLGNIGENKLLLITTIQLIDEYFDLKQRITQQKKKLDEIAKKFQELKKLEIEYKEEKDSEIINLNKELSNFKKTIQESNNLYESMLDKTTKSLEKILSNTDSISKIQ